MVGIHSLNYLQHFFNMTVDNKKRIEVRLIDLVLAMRNQFRKEKDFALSDKYRKELELLGVEILDAKDGTSSWKYKD